MQSNRHRNTIPGLLAIVALVGVIGYELFSVGGSMMSDSSLRSYGTGKVVGVIGHVKYRFRAIFSGSTAQFTDYRSAPQALPTTTASRFNYVSSSSDTRLMPDFSQFKGASSSAMTLRQTSSDQMHNYGGSATGMGSAASFSVNRTSSASPISSASCLSIVAPNMHTTLHTAAADIEPVSDDHPSAPEAAMRRQPTLPKDPYLNPIGDAPYWLILLLAVGYGSFRLYRRKRTDKE